MPGLMSTAVQRACVAALPRMDGHLLDCITDDLALTLAVHGVADIQGPFAQDWRFDLIDAPESGTRIDLPPAGQDDLLGYPVTGVRVAILTDAGDAVERGSAEGEIMVAGDSVTPGYLRRPELSERGQPDDAGDAVIDANQLHVRRTGRPCAGRTGPAVDTLIELTGLRHGYLKDSPLALERTLRDLRSASLNYANDGCCWPTGHCP